MLSEVQVQAQALANAQSELSPRRLRKHSYKEAVTLNSASNAVKMSGKLPELVEHDSGDHDDHKLISKDEYAKKNTTQKLDVVADAINKMYNKITDLTTGFDAKMKPINDAIFDDQNRVLPKIETVIDHARSTDDAIQQLTAENLELRDELDILKGVVDKMANQLDTANSRINQLTAKSMEDNLVISGILEDLPKKSLRSQVHQFFQEEMALNNINDYDIIKVYRIGKYEKGRNRPILVQCTPELRRYIMINAPLLKDKVNTRGAKFYINQQLPESIAEQNREIREKIKDRQLKEELLPNTSKSKFLVKQNRLFINGQLSRKIVSTPAVHQLFPDDDTQKKINALKMRTFRAKPELGSTFRVAIMTPDTVDNVRLAYVKMFQKYSMADHIALAYLINDEDGYNDNGEFGSGFRLLCTIKSSGLNNVAFSWFVSLQVFTWVQEDLP